jgi:hypothetical protein
MRTSRNLIENVLRVLDGDHGVEGMGVVVMVDRRRLPATLYRSPENLILTVTQSTPFCRQMTKRVADREIDSGAVSRAWRVTIMAIEKWKLACQMRQ